MKKLIIFSLAVLVVPQLVFAAWWNPLTWFNSWSFSKAPSDKTELLESRIKELERQLSASTSPYLPDLNAPIIETKTATATPKSTSTSIVKPKSIPVVVTPAPTIKPLTTTPPPKDFRAECNLSRQSVYDGGSVHAQIKIYYESGKNFEIKWDKTDLDRVIDNYEAVYTLYGEGDKNISASVKRISDNYSKIISCPISVYCKDYDCLSTQEKQKSKLASITEEINRWYAEGNVIGECLSSESIIRALEYDYTMLGGKNIPGFNKEIDCASEIAPAAYKYKIGVLEKSF